MAKQQEKQFLKNELSNTQQVYLELHDQCGLCGTQLDFNVINHSALPQLKETATCPKCQITTRQKEHAVH